MKLHRPSRGRGAAGAAPTWGHPVPCYAVASRSFTLSISCSLPRCVAVDIDESSTQRPASIRVERGVRPVPVSSTIAHHTK